MAAILDTGRRWRTQFGKGTTKGSFQQSLVEIGSVVSEEKIFFNFISLFSIFSLAAILVGSLDHRTQFWKGRFGLSIKMAPTTELNLKLDPMGNSHKNLLLRNHWANCTKLLWNDSWMAPFQNCVRWSRLPTKMAAKLKIEKREMKLKKIFSRVQF
jgi:hypothetical protein